MHHRHQSHSVFRLQDHSPLMLGCFFDFHFFCCVAHYEYFKATFDSFFPNHIILRNKMLDIGHVMDYIAVIITSESPRLLEVFRKHDRRNNNKSMTRRPFNFGHCCQ